MASSKDKKEAVPAPAQEATPSAITSEQLEAKAAELEQRASELDVRAAELDDREKYFDNLEEDLRKTKAQLQEKAADLAGQAAAMGLKRELRESKKQTKPYIVTDRGQIDHDGRSHAPGADIHLDEEAAKTLLDLGAVKEIES